MSNIVGHFGVVNNKIHKLLLYVATVGKLCNKPDLKLHVFQQIHTPSVNRLTVSNFFSVILSNRL